MQTVVLKNSRTQYVLLLGVSLVLVAIGIVVIVIGDEDVAWIAWLCIAFFGLCTAVFVNQLFDNRPRILIDERGLTDRTIGAGLIAWSDIEEAYLVSVNSNHFICLELRNTDEYLPRLSPFKRKMVKANAALGFTPLSLNLSGVQAKPEDVLELILIRIALEREK